jgi:hypothetical protein
MIGFIIFALLILIAFIYFDPSTHVDKGLSEPPRGKPHGITSGVARVQAALAQISLDLRLLHPQGKPCGFAVAV